jgi:hypothetical protein
MHAGTRYSRAVEAEAISPRFSFFWSKFVVIEVWEQTLCALTQAH